MSNYEDIQFKLTPNDDQLRILQGLSPKKGRYQQSLDKNGNNLWFYWIMNEHPMNNLKIWLTKLNSVDPYMINGKKESLIYKTIVNDKKDVFDFLIEKYDLDLFCSNKNMWCENLIHASVWSGNHFFLKKFLTEEKDLDEKNNEGMTPLMIATHIDIELVKLLLLAGANPNITDNKKKSALHYAADNPDTTIYSLIEDCGGYGDIIDCLGRTPEEILHKNIEKDEIKIKSTENYWIKQLKKRQEL